MSQRILLHSEEKIEDWKLYLYLLGGCTIVAGTTVIGALMPKKIMKKYEKEFLIFSLATITSLVFIEFIPDIISEGDHKNSKYLGITFLCGLVVSLVLQFIHELTQHFATNKENEEQIISFCNIPKTALSIWIGTSVHNFVDGAILGVLNDPKSIFILVLSLVGHEIAHALSDITLYMSLGMGKKKSVLLRMSSDLNIFIGAFLIRIISDKNNKWNDIMHIHGHAFVAGIFIFLMLVEIYPSLIGNHSHNHSHNHNNNQLSIHNQITIQMEEANNNITNDSTNNNNNNQINKHNHNYMRLLIRILIFTVSFGVTTTIIWLYGHGSHNHNHNHNCNH